MSSELILAGNGPGELTGWIRPVARAARAVAGETGETVRLTLALSPSQFAGGRELAVVQQWGIFDQVLDPRSCTRLALGLGRFPVGRNAALVHLGGELWLSGRIAARLGIPACALAETTLIARRHRGFAKVFAVSEKVAAALATRGIPREKILVTGDPRVDALPQIADRHVSLPTYDLRPTTDGITNRYLVSFLPGSRDRFFQVLVPSFLRHAGAVAAMLPGTAFQMIISPFLSPALVEAARKAVKVHAPGLEVTWVTGEAWAALTRSDLVVTIPGSNTLELAMAGVPFVVVVDTDLMDRAAVEGPLQWLARLPWLGAPLKRMALSRYLTRHRFVALPNQLAGRPLVPEWIGRWTPQALAERVTALLHDSAQRQAMAAALRGLYQSAPGASLLIARHALALAGREPVRSR